MCFEEINDKAETNGSGPNKKILGRIKKFR